MMNVREALEKLLRDSDETGDWGSPGRDDDAELLALIIERALRAERMVGYGIGCETPKGFYTLKNIEDMPLTAGIAAMKERS